MDVEEVGTGVKPVLETEEIRIGDEPVLETEEIRTGKEPVPADVEMGTGDMPVREMGWVILTLRIFRVMILRRWGNSLLRKPHKHPVTLLLRFPRRKTPSNAEPRRKRIKTSAGRTDLPWVRKLIALKSQTSPSS